MLNIGSQLRITIGIVAANLIGGGASLALAAVPAAIITLGS